MEDLVHVNHLLDLLAKTLANARDIHRPHRSATPFWWISHWSPLLHVKCAFCYQSLHVSSATNLPTDHHFFSKQHHSKHAQHHQTRTKSRHSLWFDLLVRLYVGFGAVLHMGFYIGGGKIKLWFEWHFSILRLCILYICLQHTLWFWIGVWICLIIVSAVLQFPCESLSDKWRGSIHSLCMLLLLSLFYFLGTNPYAKFCSWTLQYFIIR